LVQEIKSFDDLFFGKIALVGENHLLRFGHKLDFSEGTQIPRVEPSLTTVTYDLPDLSDFNLFQELHPDLKIDYTLFDKINQISPETFKQVTLLKKLWYDLKEQISDAKDSVEMVIDMDKSLLLKALELVNMGHDSHLDQTTMKIISNSVIPLMNTAIQLIN